MEITKQSDQAQEPKNPENKPLHAGYHIPLSLVVVGTETALFQPESKVRERILAYTKLFKEVHIIVLCGGNYKAFELGNVKVYPTNSSSRLGRFFDGIRMGKMISNADVVTVQDPFETGLVGWRIAKRLHAPLHVQVHTDFLSREYAALSLLNSLRVFIAGIVLRRAARIRVVSNRIKESIQKRFRTDTPIAVLPIFVDINYFKFAEPLVDEPFFNEHVKGYKVLIVARNAPEKNIALGIRAFEHAAPQDAFLLVTAPERTVRSISRDTRIMGIGVVDAARFYKSVDLVLVPSAYEGYGLVIIEALAAGKPVLATDVGIAREAGAIVTTPGKFPTALKEWFDHGPRTGELKNYPYKSFDEYVRAYCDDIAACKSGN